MFGKRDNYFISRMKKYMNTAIENSPYHVSCAEEIKPMIIDFYTKAMSIEINCQEFSDLCWQIDDIAEAILYLAENTRIYEEMSKEEVEVFKKLFEEFEKLLDETLELSSLNVDKEYIQNKISCMSEIVCKNMCDRQDIKKDHENWRNGMIFQNYENLWKVIHRVNTEWDELCDRDFSTRVFYDFWDAFKTDRRRGEEMSEEEKFKTFMAVLDGKKKFIPTYIHEYTLLGYKIVDNDFADEIVYDSVKKQYLESYHMRELESETTEK